MAHSDTDSDLDRELEELDDEDDMPNSYREQRLAEIKRDFERNRMMKEMHHGEVTEYKDERQLMQTVAKVKYAIVHFYHPDFRRCALMNSRLEKLAAKHFNTLFLKADVANVPFLVTKLELKVLPCVISFLDGISKDRIIGFEGLSIDDSDSFTLAELEARLNVSGVLGSKEEKT